MEALIFVTALLAVAISFQVVVSRPGSQAERAIVPVKEKRQHDGDHNHHC